MLYHNYIDIGVSICSYHKVYILTMYHKLQLMEDIMPGLAIFVVAIFAAALTGMFTRVKNQKTTSGVVVSVEHKYDSGEKNRPFTPM